MSIRDDLPISTRDGTPSRAGIPNEAAKARDPRGVAGGNGASGGRLAAVEVAARREAERRGKQAERRVAELEAPLGRHGVSLR